MAFIGGITATEVVGSDTGSFTKDSATITRMYDVDWHDALNFIKYVLGGVETIGGVSYVHRPQRFKTTDLYAVSAKYEGIGEPDSSLGYITYTKARVTVEYGVPTDDAGDDEADVWAEESTSFKTEVLTIPGKSLKFKGTSIKLNEPTGIIVVTGDINFTRYNVDPGSFATLKYNLLVASGKVNSDTWNGYLPGTLLLMGFSPRRTINVYGQSSKWTVTVGFKWKPTMWNYFYRPGVGWAECVIDSIDTPLYRSTAFGDL